MILEKALENEMTDAILDQDVLQNGVTPRLLLIRIYTLQGRRFFPSPPSPPLIPAALSFS